MIADEGCAERGCPMHDWRESKGVMMEPQRQWVGLTFEDRVQIKVDAKFNQFMTAGEYADRIQQLTEAKLKEKNT